MTASFLARWGARLACLLLGPLAAAQVPGLDHDAPFLGRVLELRVSGGAADAQVVLYVAPSAARMATPYGLFELDRAVTEIASIGTTDASGAWSTVLDLPSDERWAERELHLQAIVRHVAAPGGAVLSEARHLRVVGPRVYAGYAGVVAGPEGDQPGGLQIVSLVNDSVVAEVELGLPPSGWTQALGDDAPVFADDLAQGALITPGGDLRVFDPFFGGILGAWPFIEPSRTLHLGPVPGEVVVLETGYLPDMPPVTGRLHFVDLETGVPTAQLELPGLAPGVWATSPDRSVAFIGELDALTGRPMVRLVDLVRRQVRGAVPVGRPHHTTFTDLVPAAGQVFVTTWNDDFENLDATLSRLDLSTGTVTQLVTTRELCSLEPAPAHEELLFACRSYLGFGGRLSGVPLAAPGPVHEYPDAGFFFVPGIVRVRESEAWVLDLEGDEPPNGDDPARLWYLDLPTETWTLHPTVWYGPDGPPVAMDVVLDAYVSDVVLARRAAGVGGPAEVDPALLLIDVRSGAEVTLPLGPSPYCVKGVATTP